MVSIGICYQHLFLPIDAALPHISVQVVVPAKPESTTRCGQPFTHIDKAQPLALTAWGSHP